MKRHSNSACDKAYAHSACMHTTHAHSAHTHTSTRTHAHMRMHTAQRKRSASAAHGFLLCLRLESLEPEAGTALCVDMCRHV